MGQSQTKPTGGEDLGEGGKHKLDKMMDAVKQKFTKTEVDKEKLDTEINPKDLNKEDSIQEEIAKVKSSKEEEEEESTKNDFNEEELKKKAFTKNVCGKEGSIKKKSTEMEPDKNVTTKEKSNNNKINEKKGSEQGARKRCTATQQAPRYSLFQPTDQPWALAPPSKNPDAAKADGGLDNEGHSNEGNKGLVATDFNDDEVIKSVFTDTINAPAFPSR